MKSLLLLYVSSGRGRRGSWSAEADLWRGELRRMSYHTNHFYHITYLSAGDERCHKLTLSYEVGILQATIATLRSWIYFANTSKWIYAVQFQLLGVLPRAKGQKRHFYRGREIVGATANKDWWRHQRQHGWSVESPTVISTTWLALRAFCLYVIAHVAYGIILPKTQTASSYWDST